MPDPTANTPTENEFTAQLVEFIRLEFVAESDRAQLTSTTPLMESGILDSLRVAVLLTFIRDSLGVSVPLTEMVTQNFRDIETIAAVLREASADLAAEGAK